MNRETSSLTAATHPAPKTFRGYRLAPVYLTITEAERNEVMAMWQQAGAFRDPSVAESRSREVVMLIRHAATSDVVGVSTVGLKPGPGGELYYHFRMFLRPEHRQPYLMREVTNGTRDFLRGFRHPGADPVGMLIVTENRKLMRAGIKRYLSRHGYDYRGCTPGGLDLWLTCFSEDRQSQG